LGNQVQFLHSIRNELPRLLRNVRLRPAAVRTAHARDDAKAARMIASLRNLHVGKMPRREPEPWCRKIRNVNRTRVHIQHGGLRVAQILPFITGRFAMRFLDLRKSSYNGRLWILDFGFWASLES